MVVVLFWSRLRLSRQQNRLRLRQSQMTGPAINKGAWRKSKHLAPAAKGVPGNPARKLLEAVIVFGSVFLLALIYLNIQAPASLAPGFDWDEKQYRLMATQFRARGPKPGGRRNTYHS